MFSFGFNGTDRCSNVEEQEHEQELDWEISKEIEVEQSPRGSERSIITYQLSVPGLSLNLVPTEEALRSLEADNSCIAQADALHSDLVPAKYEGGLKVWECTEDLAEYLLKEKVLQDAADTNVLDLGCGAGVLGILALQYGATVHFQDYNEEVLRSYTSVNVGLNTSKEAQTRCRYFSGDWQSFAKLTDTKYDLILTSETIYNPACYKKLLAVFTTRLKATGVVLLAAKTYYFGVGGGLRQFESKVQDEVSLQSTVVWKCSQGVHREILRISKR